MVISIKKRTLAIASAILLTLFVFVTTIFTSAQPAKAVGCPAGQVQVTLLGSGLLVCVPEVRLPTVTVTLPRVTVTATLPRRTVRLPRATVRQTVRVPGPVRTSVITVNKVNTVNGEVTAGPRQTVTRSATITRPAATATVTATQTVHTHSTKEVVITKTVATGIGLALILLGIALGLLILWGAYTYGWLQGDGGNRKFLREVRDELKFRD